MRKTLEPILRKREEAGQRDGMGSQRHWPMFSPREEKNMIDFRELVMVLPAYASTVTI